jgi:coronin-1B/1C/6
MRAYKTVNDTYIEPISFTVPRRAETFQADIFPPATGTKPACTAKEWLDGKTAIPAKIDLESIYEGSAPKEVAADYKPPVQSTPPTPKAETKKPEPPKEEPKPSTSRGPPPTIKDQKTSISAMANKFQDNTNEEEEEDDGDETSSFEEVSRPAQRSSMPIRSEPKPAAAASPAKPTPAAAPAAAASPAIETPARSATPAKTPTGASTPVSAGVETSLEQIKQMIESQTKIMKAQNDKIGSLTAEVESLKRKIGTSSGSQDQSERIRQLELELEEARS